jgi:uncharacterized protein (TIGR02284 family)
MSNNHAISKLDDLITTLIDSVKGYSHSAEKARSAEFQTLFRELAAEREQAVMLLQARSEMLGGKPNRFGSAAGTVHRRLEDILVALGGGDKAVVQAIDRGEDYLREEFERVRKDDAIDAETREVVERAFQSVARGRALIDALKQSVDA